MKRVACLLVILLFSASLYCQGLFESVTSSSTVKDQSAFNVNGFVRGMAFGAGNVYDVSNAFGEVSLQARLKKDRFLMNSDIRFRSGYQFNQSLSEFEVKEAYAGISTTSIDLFLGEQIVSWGRTDGFNPTNNITPNNYFFLSANPDDQKIPNFLLKAKFRFSTAVSWEIIAIPVFRPSMYRYELFDMGEDVSFASALLPDKTLGSASLATKINLEFSGFGFSASWFSGYDPFYGFDLKSVSFATGKPVITYIPSFYRKNSIGIDFSVPLGTWIFRGESAFDLTVNDEEKMFVPNKNIGYVAAIEHDFGGFTTIVQYIGKYTFDFTQLIEPVLNDPMNGMAQLQYANDMIRYESTFINRKIFHQQEEMNHAVSLIISRDFDYETFNVELSGYYDFTSGEYLVRPKLSWKVGDGFSLTAGYSYMKGPEKSVFGYAAPIMNGAFLEFKASF